MTGPVMLTSGRAPDGTQLNIHQRISPSVVARYPQWVESLVRSGGAYWGSGVLGPKLPETTVTRTARLLARRPARSRTE